MSRCIYLRACVRLRPMPSDGSAVVLLHGLNASGNAWQDVAPLLRSYHQVYAPTAIGHRGGPPVQRRPVTIRDVVDWAERYLDEHGLQRPHLVGHSMGGFVAIELARRGRAASVCAFAPGGFWSSGDGLRTRTMTKVRKGAVMALLTRPITPLRTEVVDGASALVPWERRVPRRSNNREAGRSDRRRLHRVRSQRRNFFDRRRAHCTSRPLPCPVTLAWSEKDAILPVAWYGPNARERLPQAAFKLLPDVGHDPMMDDPSLVARTILAATGAAKN